MLTLLALAALLTAGSAPRRALGLLLGLLLLLFPPTASTPLARGVLAAIAFWGLARLLDLAREPRPMSPLRRVAHALAIVDTRRVTLGRPRVDGRALGRAALALPLGYLSLWAGVVLAPAIGSLPLRWLAGATFTYCFAEAASGLIEGLARLLGARVPPVHRDPVAARSLREFWGERWNLVVNRWLRQHWYLPLARRGRPATGLALAFVVSAGLHAYIFGAGLDADMSARAAGFFALQGLLLALEVPLGVQRWPAPAARAWTLAATLLPSPLFTEPMLRLFAELVAEIAWV